jgi:two-component system, OmpR family, response regulator
MRILVVEDERKIALAIKKGLEQETYAVDVAFDADEGLATGLAEDYDLIILDRMLPGSMEGLEVCRTFRKEGVKCPIIMLTAKDRVVDKVEGLDVGADDYLTKPFSFEELLARIRALLRRPQSPIGAQLVCGDLALDPANKSVRRAGKNIELSPREFALLEFMIRNQGKLLSKDQIIGHVWDFDSDILPNTVEAFVKSLRTKIEKPFPKSKKLIQTKRGFGYKLQANED